MQYSWLCRDEAYRQLSSALKCNQSEQEGIPFGEMEMLLKTIFEKADCEPNALAAYEVLHALMNQGKLGIKACRVSGVREGIDAPEFRMRLKD